MAVILKEGGSNRIQILAVLSVLLVVFCSGLHFGWPSASLPIILSPDFPISINSEEASYIATISTVGMIVGSLSSSVIVDIIGRKTTILLITIPQILSMVLICFAVQLKALFYVGRLIGGIAEGAIFTAVPIYIGEIAEPKIRGILGTFFTVSLILGMLSASIAGYYLNIRNAAILYATFPIVFIIFFIKMPESPYFLLMKKRVDKARLNLQKLFGKKDVQTELDNLTNDVTRQLSESGKYKDLFLIKSNRMAVISMVGLRLVQQLSGITAINIYAQSFFKEATNLIPKNWATSLFLSIQVLSTLVASCIVDKAGRKPLLIFSCCGCFITLGVQALYFTVILDYSANLSFIPLIFMVIYIMCFASGLGSVVNLMLGELFSASIKAKASNAMVIVFAISMFISTKFYQTLVDNFGLGVPLGVFAICQIFGALFVHFFVPETKGKTLEQIQQEFKGKGCETTNKEI